MKSFQLFCAGAAARASPTITIDVRLCFSCSNHHRRKTADGVLLLLCKARNLSFAHLQGFRRRHPPSGSPVIAEAGAQHVVVTRPLFV